jgi:hypothetical protein
VLDPRPSVGEADGMVILNEVLSHINILVNVLS